MKIHHIKEWWGEAPYCRPQYRYLEFAQWCENWRGKIWSKSTRGIWGVTPPGGPSTKGESEKRGFSWRRRRREKFLSAFFGNFGIFEHFLEIFGNFVNKNAIKRDFWGGLGRYISKISKNAHFFEVFGKIFNKNAIKRDFWGVVGRYISKISKKSPFLGKNTSTNFQKFWDTSTKVG